MKQPLLLQETDLRWKDGFREQYSLAVSSCTQAEGRIVTNEFVRRLQMEYQPRDGLVTLQATSEALHPPAEPVAQAASAAVHTAVFRLHASTGAVTLANGAAIRERWAMIREQLGKDYKGPAVAVFIAGYDNLIQDPAALTDALLQYNLYGLFLNQVNVPYPYTGQMTVARTLLHSPDLPALPVAETRILQHNATVAIRGAAPLLKEYSGMYTLDRDTHVLRHAVLRYRIEIGNVYLRTCRFRITNH